MSNKIEELNKVVSEFDNKSDSELNLELAAAAREEKELDLIIKRETVAKIKAEYNAKRDRAKSAQIAIKQYMAQREAQQRACNHLKGGTGAQAFLQGLGDSPYYAVIKHKKPNNRWMVLCQRCNKEWHEGHTVLDEPETPGFQEAIRFNTNNTASHSTTFTYEKEARA